ncbi:MAG: ribosome silencing factor [Clostridia bacterium]|nr:ribosome silencing factor [Clostridia bacterium]
MERIKTIVEALDDKRAKNIDVLDISKLTSLGDYFIICTCGSESQVRACVDNVEEKMEERGIACAHKEGYTNGSWVLMDYSDIIVHIMQEETRNFYSLEKLWDDAPRIETGIEEN